MPKLTPKNRFTMPFEPMTIRHLGLQLYSTFPPVISELVSNAFDAESATVEITVPTGEINSESEVIVKDWGHGLTAAELQNEYLPIGRNRRGDNAHAVRSRNGKRIVTGRKGLGKLSAFGIAEEMEIRSVNSGNAICIKMNLNEMLDWSTKHGTGQPYVAEFVDERSGRTSEPNGVEITLRDLRRKTRISQDELRRGLARRLHVIKSGFSVKLNGVAISSKDRVRREDCADGFVWDVDELPRKGKVSSDCIVSGWLGFTENSSQIGRGVNLIANGKAVELGSFFNFPSTHSQFARAYLVGEVNANFLDGEEDLVSTARNSVVWESEWGQDLEGWGQSTLTWLFNEWLKKRKANKERTIITNAGFDEWLKNRPAREQKIANRMVKILVDDPKIETASAVPLFEIIKSSVETIYFQELVETIEKKGTSAAELLSLFGEWRLIEARAHLHVADGRSEAMKKLKYFMDNGALEVQQIQPLLENHLWLLNPKWTEADGQTTYTKLLREHCKEPKEYDDVDRRLDIMGITTGGSLTITEIKRPEKKLNRNDLDQISRYVDWARTQFEGTGGHAPMYISGLLVVGSLSDRGDVQKAMKRLASDDIRVETYNDLYEAAHEYYNDAEIYLKTIAPEFAKSSRKAASNAGGKKKKTANATKKKSTRASKKPKVSKKANAKKTKTFKKK